MIDYFKCFQNLQICLDAWDFTWSCSGIIWLSLTFKWRCV